MILSPEQTAIRLGFGLSPLGATTSDSNDLIASIERAGPNAQSVNINQVRRIQRHVSKLNSRASKGDGTAKDAARQASKQAAKIARTAVQRRFARAVGAPVGFGERLVQFWADHFTVSDGNPYLRLMAAAFVEEAIRPHIGGNFADMMFAAETHPRMLTYLSQKRSFGPNSRIARRKKDRHLGLNENLAREMIELHSLGVGADYTQKDVRQLAKLLTGLTYNSKKGMIFRPSMAEPGAEVVLGRSYGDDGQADLQDVRAVISDLALHESTAQHIARKLVVHFVSDNPPQKLVDRLAAIYRDSGGQLSDVYTVLIAAPELAAQFRQKIRPPFEFVVSAVRALGLNEQDVMALRPRKAMNHLVRPLTAMGQKWGYPLGPDGWPESAESWVTPQGLAARIDWSTRSPAKLCGDFPDPREFLVSALGDTASEALHWAVPRAETARDGVAIVLSSADFNRR